MSSNSKLTPKLRFPEFRKEPAWEETKLGQLGKLISGLTYSPEDVRDQGLLVLRSSNVQDGEVALDDCVYVTPSINGANLAEPNDILICVRNGSKSLIGKNALIPEGMPRCTHGAFMTVLRAQAPRFVFQLLQTKSYYKQVAGDLGATINSINGSQLLKYRFIVPSPAEQQKIADCLASLDELIAGEGRKWESLRAFKKGLMQQLFPSDGETTPRQRFPEFRDKGEWELSSVGELVEANCLFPPKDGNHGNIHPKSSDYVTKGIPFIMASDLNGGLVNTSNCHFIRKEQADKLQKGFAMEGDVLLSHKGTVGEVAVVKKIDTPYLMLTPQVTYYRVKDKTKLSNAFLAQIFVSDDFQSNLYKASGGGTRAYIGITEQAKLSMTLPKGVNEQQRIADCLSSLDTQIAAQSERLAALRAHKKGLMQQLFPSAAEA